jgi:RNA polymerase sigma-70 factor (ECF subfamily)
VQSRNDDELIREAQAGDADAFRSLYERHKSAVYTYCLRMLRHGADAADATQNAFLRAFEGLRSLDHPASFKYWLYTIVRNEIYARIRRRTAGRQIPLDDLDDRAWDDDTPHECAVRAEVGVLIRTLIDALRPEYREVLMLREFEGFTYAEIAAVTGDSEASVKARLFKARKALAAKCEAVFFERANP